MSKRKFIIYDSQTLVAPQKQVFGRAVTSRKHKNSIGQEFIILEDSSGNQSVGECTQPTINEAKLSSGKKKYFTARTEGKVVSNDF